MVVVVQPPRNEKFEHRIAQEPQSSIAVGNAFTLVVSPVSASLRERSFFYCKRQ